MTNWKCPSDIFSFCNGTPDWEKEPFQQDMLDKDGKPTKGPFIGGKCKLNKDDCGRLVSFTELVKIDPKLQKSTLIEKVIPIEKSSKEKEEKPKVKSAKAKKFEAELAQRPMF